MTIAFDADSSSATAIGNLSWTHTPVADSQGIIVWVGQWSDSGTASDDVTSVDYGGESMTRQVAQVQTVGTEEGASYIYLSGSSVPTGAQTVDVTVTSGDTKIATAISVTAAADVESEATAAKEAASGADASIVVATTASLNCFVVGGNKSGRIASGLASGTDFTEVLEQENETADGASACNFMRKTDNSTGGDVTLDWVHGSDEACIAALAIKEGAVSSSATTRDLQDSATFSDDLARNFWGDRLGADIRDVFTFSDSMVADLILIRELSDAVATFADQLNKDAIYIRTPQDSVTFVDDLARDQDLVRELQDTSTFSDALVDLLHFLRELQDTVSFSDALARDQDLVRLVQDTLTLVENLDRTNTGDVDTVSDHHRFKLWQNLRRWRLYKPRDQIH